MKTRIVSGLLILLLLYPGGCAVHKSITLDPHFWQQQGKRVGVYLLAFPLAKATEFATPTYIFGNVSPLAQGEPLWNNDMDYEPLRLSDMRPLQQASQEQGAEEFSRVQDLFVEGLRGRGFTAFKVQPPMTKKYLPTFKGGKEGPYEKRDYRGLGKTRNADYLIVIELVRYGPYCHYIYAYNDHMEVQVQVRAEMLDMRDNRILWKMGENFHRPVDASCSDRDQIPIITDALKNLLADAAQSVPRSFFPTHPPKPQKIKAGTISSTIRSDPRARS
jgi:hypothetical protein